VNIALGLTGPNSAGKGEVAAYLSRNGFEIHSLSDIVREEALESGLTTGRGDLILTGNLLREEGGPGVLAERILSRLHGRDVIDSIRNPAEVEILRKLPHFLLLGVWAPVEVRFERSLARGRAGDPATLAEFRAREEEENSSDPNAQQLQATFRMADRRLTNDGDLDQLHRALDGVIAEY
jgi:dephospho-CoA kinase